MLEEYQNNVLKAYNSRKKSDQLSSNLLHPTTANLKKECAVVFNNRPNDNIKSTLQSFGAKGFQINDADDILTIDSDKFRPLQSFINGDVVNPNAHNVKLLAWLINFGSVEDIGKNSNALSDMLAYFKHNKLTITISLVVVALGIVAVKVMDTTKQCMYWNGDHYEVVGCKIKIDHATVIALDEQKVKRLKRITRVDTIGEKNLSKIWYVKVKVDSAEFYTDSGAYPLDPRKRLLPITPYILNKYILEKARPID